MADWQPIETAPRDGTVVLLYAPGWGRLSTGWTYGNDDWQDAPYSPTRADYRPTMWQPCPEPPTPPPSEGGA